MAKLNICKNISDTYIVIHVLACFIGIASWVDMSGLWLQLPIFVTVLPEQWTLASFVVLLQQAANIGPIIFVICACVFATKKVEQPTSCIIIVIGIIACVLLSFFWDKTTVIGGAEHSTALFALSFLLAFVDTTSSLAFLSFMAMLKPQYLPSYFVGEGLSSLLPALVAFGQGSGNVNCVNISAPTSELLENGTWNNFTIYYEVPIYAPPKFSVQAFFLILAAFLALSLISFILLMCFPKCDVFVSAYSSSTKHGKSRRSYSLEKSAYDNPTLDVKEIGFTITEFGVLNLYVDSNTDKDGKGTETTKPNSNASIEDKTENSIPVISETQNSKPVLTNNVTNNTAEAQNSQPISTISPTNDISKEPKPASSKNLTNNMMETTHSKSSSDGDPENPKSPVSMTTFIFLLAQTCWKGILFTTTMSIQPYFSLPFGLKVYHLANTLGTVALPVGCLLCLFLPMHSIVGVTILSLMYTGLTAYFFYMAAMSPSPPLIDHEAGPAVLITLGIVLMLIWTYSEVAIAGILRPGGRRAMIWFGVSIQIGSLIGGIAAYVMVNVFRVFKDAQPC